jgi:hypothetical protein
MSSDYVYGYNGMLGESLAKGHGAETQIPDLNESTSIGPYNPAAGMGAVRYPENPRGVEAAWHTYYQALEVSVSMCVCVCVHWKCFCVPCRVYHLHTSLSQNAQRPDTICLVSLSLSHTHTHIQILSRDMLRMMALGLGLPETRFDECLTAHRSALRFLNYPAQVRVCVCVCVCVCVHYAFCCCTYIYTHTCTHRTNPR